jgi:hypothetical protein
MLNLSIMIFYLILHQPAFLRVLVDQMEWHITIHTPPHTSPLLHTHHHTHITTHTLLHTHHHTHITTHTLLHTHHHTHITTHTSLHTHHHTHHYTHITTHTLLHTHHYTHITTHTSPHTHHHTHITTHVITTHVITTHIITHTSNMPTVWSNRPWQLRTGIIHMNTLWPPYGRVSFFKGYSPLWHVTHMHSFNRLKNGSLE